jgi:RNA polymerase sigma factor (TIGR02999 family)
VSRSLRIVVLPYTALVAPPTRVKVHVQVGLATIPDDTALLSQVLAMSDVTQILYQIEEGDGQAAEKLLPVVYEELRKLAAAKMAQENPGQTLQATALVHEAYIRLVDVDKVQHWNSRGHFFGAAAEAMRRILLNRARDKNCQKRSGRLRRIDLNKIEIATDTPDDDLIALNEAIDRLAEENQDCASLVKMRFFAGLSVHEAADLLGFSDRTAKRHWTYARAWLFEALNCDDTPSLS